MPRREVFGWTIRCCASSASAALPTFAGGELLVSSLRLWPGQPGARRFAPGSAPLTSGSPHPRRGYVEVSASGSLCSPAVPGPLSPSLALEPWSTNCSHRRPTRTVDGFPAQPVCPRGGECRSLRRRQAPDSTRGAVSVRADGVPGRARSDDAGGLRSVRSLPCWRPRRQPDAPGQVRRPGGVSGLPCRRCRSARWRRSRAGFVRELPRAVGGPRSRTRHHGRPQAGSAPHLPAMSLEQSRPSAPAAADCRERPCGRRAVHRVPSTASPRGGLKRGAPQRSGFRLTRSAPLVEA